MSQFRDDRKAATISNGFIRYKLAIFCNARCQGIAAVIRCKGSGSFCKGVIIRLGPPVYEIAILIRMTAIGIKGMGYFMADDDTNAA